MKLVISGGGTGGHIYPALEIAKAARAENSDVLYVGSLRGQEGMICERERFDFKGFPAQPLYSLKRVSGWRSLLSLLQATHQVKSLFKTDRPDAVFSTGGYSAAPVMAAARSLKIPYVIHESNSIPGRSNRLFASAATAFSCVFETTLSVVSKAVRTGQPIRAELRDAASQAYARGNSSILSVGGSQGSAFLNKLIVGAADLGDDATDWTLATGRSNFEKIRSDSHSPNLKIVPFLEIEALASAYQAATLVVARSGGTVAELAMFGIPSILIPLPTSADDHQLKNAEEFVSFGGAKLLKQEAASPQKLLDTLMDWQVDQSGYERARTALKAWDQPNAISAILHLVNSAAGKN